MLPSANSLHCPICKSLAVKKWNDIYFECQSCGHHYNETLLPPEMVNENLSAIDENERDALEGFKRAVLKLTMQENNLLIDYGSGSGKFLYLNKDLFLNVLGVETSKPCVSFSKQTLKLQIHDTIEGLPAPSVISFWHSLEHLTISHAGSVFSQLAHQSTAQMRLIVSVPQGTSLLHRLLRENDPYYDPQTHYQEFSRKSLEIFLSEYGMSIDNKFFSFSYSIFGWAQGLSNFLHPQRNYFYNRFRRSQAGERLMMDAMAWVVFALVMPVSCALALAERYGLIEASVLTISAKKKS